MLVFEADPQGTLVAYHAGTGARLWSAPAGGGTATPVTYEIDGRQYVADRRRPRRRRPDPRHRVRAAHHREAVTYRPDIDGLRAIAVLSVVAYHADAALLPGGFAGVDVFFVISGFLITSLLVQSLADETFSAATFYARRLRRLLPSLVVVLAAAAVAGWAWLLPGELVQLGTHIASSAVFVTNFVLWGEAGYFDAAAADKPLLHLWSLGVEEQFYLLWPALLWITWRRARPLAIVAGVAVLSFAANVATTHWAPAAAFYWPTSRVWELAVGAVLACLPAAVANAAAAPRARDVCALAGVLLLAAGLALLRGDAAFPGWWAVLPVAGTACLIAAGPHALLNRAVLAHRGLVFIGLTSYPLYLWHWPMLTFARLVSGGRTPAPVTAALVAAAVLLAWLSYRCVEVPLRHRRSRWIVPGLAGALACAGAAGLALRVQADSLPRRLPADVQALADFTYRPEAIYRERVCYLMPDQPPSALAPECTESAPADRPLVVLWGDSHAAHLYPGLQDLQTRTPFRLAEFTGSRCPPLLGVETPTQPVLSGPQSRRARRAPTPTPADRAAGRPLASLFTGDARPHRAGGAAGLAGPDRRRRPGAALGYAPAARTVRVLHPASAAARALAHDVRPGPVRVGLRARGARPRRADGSRVCVADGHALHARGVPDEGAGGIRPAHGVG